MGIAIRCFGRIVSDWNRKIFLKTAFFQIFCFRKMSLFPIEMGINNKYIFLFQMETGILSSVFFFITTEMDCFYKKELPGF